MEYKIQRIEGAIHIDMSGQFTFSDNQNFKQILELANGVHTKEIALNLGGVGFIDSAGMGMLLLLRDSCQSNKVALVITGIHGQVEKIFNISKFDQLFTIR